MKPCDVIRERFATYDDARNFVKAKAWELFGPVNYASMPRKGEYYATFGSNLKDTRHDQRPDCRRQDR